MEIKAISLNADQMLSDFERGMRRALEESLLEIKKRLPAATQLTADSLIATRNEIAAKLGGS